MRHLCLPASLTLLALWAAPAAAQDTAPVIEELQDGNGETTTILPQGAILWIKGRNLHKCPPPPDPADKRNPCKHEELEVTLDGEVIYVLASTFDLVTAQIPPSAKVGKATVKVTVRGRGKAQAKLEILSMEEYRKRKGDEDRHEGPGQGSSENPADKIRQGFRITKFAMVAGGAGSRFEVEGVVPEGIPDGFRVEVSLNFDSRSIVARRVEVADGGFKTTFGPFREKLLYGIYECLLEFSLGTQSRAAVRRWERERRREGKKELSSEEMDALSRILRRELAEVGTGPKNAVTAEDRQRQQDALQAHVKQLHDSAGKLYRELDEAWSVAARCRFKQPGESSYDKERYRTWLVRQEYAADEKAAEAIERDTRYGTASGHFKAREYEAWATQGDSFRAKLEALHKEHAAFAAEYICPIDERAHMLGDYLLSVLERTLQRHAQELYSRSKLAVPEAISSLRLDVIPAPEDGRKYFFAKRRELLRQVGLDAFVE